MNGTRVNHKRTGTVGSVGAIRGPIARTESERGV